MFSNSQAFSGFSVNDLTMAKQFYGEILGLELEDQNGMGFTLNFANGGRHFVYEKDDHRPASFTVLNFPVENIDTAVDELAAKGISLERYDGMPQDGKGVMRGSETNMGPDIAWFKDPAGNVLAVLQD